MANTFGKLFTLTTFGESHGEAIGGIIDGCPANQTLDLKLIQQQLNRRKPGQSRLVSPRKEKDLVHFSSGLFEGKTTGSPLAFRIENTNSKSKDYDHLKGVYRPSHADFTYQKKYGWRDHRGGGRSSARETANWVVAGAVAKQLLPSINIQAYVDSVGKISLEKDHTQLDLSTTENSLVRCPDAELSAQMEQQIDAARKAGDSLGGTITCVVKNVPIGWGEPIFDKLHARLAYAMLTLNAAKGFEYGSGFAGSQQKGSEHNDLFTTNQRTKTNFSGGIQGGISNGMDIYFRVAFKPVATLLQTQPSINEKGEALSLEGRGRHDPCVVPRAVPIVEALTAMVLFDFSLLHKART